MKWLRNAMRAQHALLRRPTSVLTHRLASSTRLACHDAANAAAARLPRRCGDCSSSASTSTSTNGVLIGYYRPALLRGAAISACAALVASLRLPSQPARAEPSQTHGSSALLPAVPPLASSHSQRPDAIEAVAGQPLSAALWLAQRLALVGRGLWRCAVLGVLALPPLLWLPVHLLLLPMATPSADEAGATAAAWRCVLPRLLCWSCELAGPAFIKLGQWASTRPDLFPPDACAHLARLHADVAPEPMEHVARVLSSLPWDTPTHASEHHHDEQPLGTTLGGAGGINNALEHLDPHPLGAGCVAQVHRAVLTEQAACCVGL